jgi:nucleoside 2-deoxyribosyltransferase
MRIYMAGPLFTTAEFEFNKALAARLRALGHEVHLPQEFEAQFREGKLDTKAIFHSDVDGIDWGQLTLGNLDGADSDSGTCWELGYSYAKGKYIIVYRTDLRIGRDDVVNLMMTESANVVHIAALQDVDKLAEAINMEIRLRFESHKRWAWQEPRDPDYSGAVMD